MISYIKKIYPGETKDQNIQYRKNSNIFYPRAEWKVFSKGVVKKSRFGLRQKFRKGRDNLKYILRIRRQIARRRAKIEKIKYLKKIKKFRPKYRRPLSFKTTIIRTYPRTEYANKLEINTLNPEGLEFYVRFMIQQVNIKKGKKAKAVKIVDNLISYLKKKYRKRDHNMLLGEVFENAKVLVHLRSKRVGSMVYKVPVNLRYYKAMRLVARWLSSQRRSSPGKNSFENVREELLSLIHKRGVVFKKRTELLREAHSGIPYLKYLQRHALQ